MFEKNILKNTHRGFWSVGEGKVVGHYRTKGSAQKMYLEDDYALKAKNLVERIDG